MADRETEIRETAEKYGITEEEARAIADEKPYDTVYDGAGNPAQPPAERGNG